MVFGFYPRQSAQILLDTNRKVENVVRNQPFCIWFPSKDDVSAF